MLRDGSGARWTPGTTAAQAVALVGGDAQPNALRLGRRWQGPSTPGIFAALLGTVMLDDVVRAGAGAERGFQAISTSGGGISRSVSRSAIWLGVEGVVALLPISTVFAAHKQTAQVRGRPRLPCAIDLPLSGYESHMGRS